MKCVKLNWIFQQCSGSYLKKSLTWRRYRYSMDQHNFDNFITYPRGGGGGGGGVLSHMAYTGMCCWIGYGFLPLRIQ